MKKYIIFSLSIILALLFVSCDQGDISEEVPKNNPTGDYLYTSNSIYYSSTDKVEYEGINQGSLLVDNYTSYMYIYITPNIGYSFEIQASNLDYKPEAKLTTFRISTQQLYLKDKVFNLGGTNGIPVFDTLENSIGDFDGYFTADSIVFAYKSANVENFEWTETLTKAVARN